MASLVDAQQDLENYFQIARVFGPLIVPIELKFSYQDFVDAVAERARSVYPLVEPIPARIVYVRGVTYEVNKPRPGDEMIPFVHVLRAVVEGFVKANVLYDQKQVYGLWGFRDHMPELPSDVLMVQAAWGP